MVTAPVHLPAASNVRRHRPYGARSAPDSVLDAGGPPRRRATHSSLFSASSSPGPPTMQSSPSPPASEVIPLAAQQDVVPVAAVEPVVAAEAADDVVERAPGQDVVAVGPRMLHTAADNRQTPSTEGVGSRRHGSDRRRARSAGTGRAGGVGVAERPPRAVGAPPPGWAPASLRPPAPRRVRPSRSPAVANMPEQVTASVPVMTHWTCGDPPAAACDRIVRQTSIRAPRWASCPAAR